MQSLASFIHHKLLNSAGRVPVTAAGSLSTMTAGKSQDAAGQAVAISGMAVRLPGVAGSLIAQLVAMKGIDAVRTVPADR